MNGAIGENNIPVRASRVSAAKSWIKPADNIPGSALILLLILVLVTGSCKNKQVPVIQWISAVSAFDSIPPAGPAPYFRKEFRIRGEIDQAVLRITGLGYFQAYINGKKVGDHRLDPVVTQYHKRVKVVEFDVKEMIRSGTNALGVVLGNGFYNQHTHSVWDFETAPWRDAPCLRAELLIRSQKGRQVIIATGPDWTTGEGPIRFDAIRNGEHYDARLEQPGWSEPGFDDSRWSPAQVVGGPAGILSEQVMPPIRAVRELEPVSVTHLGRGSYLLDFGENISGWVKLTLQAASGTEVILRYGEVLDEHGHLDTRELSRFIRSGETQTDRYICKGGTQESWQPSFVYHGFQYIEVEGLPLPPTSGTVKAVVAHTDLERTGDFTCSDTVLNRLQENMIRSFLSNYHGYPEDCPHREKMGWTGDAQLVAGMALYNFDMKSSYMKWMDDFLDAQTDSGQIPGIVPTSGWGFTYGSDPVYRQRGYGPQWEAAFVEIPWQLYLFTGDTSVLGHCYSGMDRYVMYLEAHSENDLLRFGIDDHKALDPVTASPILASGHYYRCAALLSRIAGVLGKPEDQSYFANLCTRIRDAFWDAYINPESGTVGNGSQTEQSLAIYFGLVPENLEKKVYARLIDALEETGWHLHTGVLGTKYVIQVLARAGYNDLLHRIITSPEYPGYGYWIAQGATTMWQTWDGKMSRNHIMFGSLGEWYYRYIAGIRPDPDSPGFVHFFVSPGIPSRLEWFQCRTATPYGTITVEFNRQGPQAELIITVPEGTTSTFSFKSSYHPIITDLISGSFIDAKNFRDTGTITVPAGKYKVTYSTREK